MIYITDYIFYIFNLFVNIIHVPILLGKGVIPHLVFQELRYRDFNSRTILLIFLLARKHREDVYGDFTHRFRIKLKQMNIMSKDILSVHPNSNALSFKRFMRSSNALYY